jgi:hypothetical protein
MSPTLRTKFTLHTQLCFKVLYIMLSLFEYDLRLPENDVAGLYNSSKRLSWNVHLTPPTGYPKHDIQLSYHSSLTQHIKVLLCF